MKVALIGASGNVGSRLLEELSRRGHEVTAFARNPEKIAKKASVTATKVDANNEAELTAALKGFDAVISAIWFSKSKPEVLIKSVKAAGVPRYLVVGGAGSLEVAPGVQLYTTEQFPDEWKPEASEGARFLKLLQAEKELDWTFLSPAAWFVEGERTGKYRLGGDQLMANAEGDSRISFEDFAKAMVDELEKPQHSRKRFSIAY